MRSGIRGVGSGITSHGIGISRFLRDLAVPFWGMTDKIIVTPLPGSRGRFNWVQESRGSLVKKLYLVTSMI